MPRLPEPIKRLILPAWNGAHRLAWAAGVVGDAVVRRRFARCEVCGRFGPVLYRRWVIPPKLEELWGLSPRVAEAMARKESSECAWCGAKLRAKRLALVLLGEYPVGNPPAPARSAADWVRHDEARALRILEMNRIEGLHDELARLPHLQYAEYQPGAEPGSVVNGVRCEDLTGLTYPDASFDLVLTSETLEHVPHLTAALGEIRRVLGPQGRHIFTVPMLPSVPKTFARSVLRTDGTIEHMATPICHPGGDVGYPVFTEFGADLPDLLRREGFETTMHFGHVTEDDVAQVLVCRHGQAGSGP